jgi:hypothetical protein
MEQIENLASEIDTTGKQLAKAIKDASEMRVDYVRAFEGELIKIRDEHKESGERLPAEEMRAALAHQRLDRFIYAKHLTAEAHVDALKAYLRALEASTSARQSLLATMREEVRLAA